MSNSNNEGLKLIAITALLLIVAVVGWFLPKSNGFLSSGATGTQNIEDYNPLVMQAGFNTAKPASFTSTLAVSGASTFTAASTFTGAFTLGTNGTSMAAIKAGACTIWAPSNTITASTTQQIVCQGSITGNGIVAITGITTDAICQLTMASSTNTTLLGLDVQGASASSTAGNIVARLANLTGTTFTWSSAASSSNQWNYSCIDPT